MLLMVSVGKEENHKEKSRYSYEYNNIALTYIAQQDYVKALGYILMADQYLGRNVQYAKLTVDAQ